MNNLTDLKEQIQEDIMTWYDGLESNHAYPYLEKIISNHGHEPNAWNDMDKLCDIVVDRFKELESKNSKLSPFFEQKL
jgi:myosin-crossreactive antigen